MRKASEPCTACGFCCTYLEFRVRAPRGRTSDEDWLSYHPGCRVVQMPYGATVRIAVGCEHLTSEGKCGIYEVRPDLCREFLCVGVENEPTLKGGEDAEA